MAAAGAALAADAPKIARVTAKGKDAAGFYWGDEWDKPFLYPIRTVSGKVLSRGYPVEKIEGEATDHVWHRGFWWGHGVVNGEDFWREQGRNKTSRLVVEGSPRTGKEHVAATMAMMTPANKRLGTVRQRYSIRDEGKLRFVDTEIAVVADQGVALTFGDTDDGGFAFRLNDAFREDRGARLLNSEGLQGTASIWGKAARWTDYSAMVGGERAGVAVFDHPSNLRYPTGWHARGYSLNAANPFASKSFSKGKGPDGAYTLPAGETLKLRYAAVIHEGAFEAAEIEKTYRKWAR